MVFALAGSKHGSTLSGNTIALSGFSTNSTNCVVVACINSLEGNTVTGVADSTGLTWTKLIAGSFGFSYPNEAWYAVATAQLTSITVTATLANSVSGPSNITCFGVSGANITIPSDPNASLPNKNSTTGSGTNVTSITSSSPFSTTNPNTFVFGQLSTFNGGPGTITEPAGFTSIIDSVGTISVDVAYQIFSTPQTNISPTYTWSSGTQYQGVIWGAIQSNQLYSGIASSPSRGNGTATVTVGNAGCGTSPYTYQWYRSTTSGFMPGAGNIVSGATSQTLNDTGLTNGITYYYVNMVTDSASNTAQSNQVSATPAPNTVVYIRKD